MQKRCLKVFMVLLILLQPLVALPSACVVSGGTSQTSLVSMGEQEEKVLPPCHEDLVPTATQSIDCTSCAGGSFCAAACSIVSPTLTCEYHSTAILQADAPFQQVTQALTSPSPSEHYRPPRLS